MAIRIVGGAPDYEKWNNVVMDDFSFEPESEINNNQDMETSSTDVDSDSEQNSSNKTNNPPGISPKKLPLGLRLYDQNKQGSPLGSNPDVARLARLSACYQTAMAICKESAVDALNKSVAALNNEENVTAGLYTERSNEYVAQLNSARAGLAKVKTRIFSGLDVISRNKQ